jgi:Tfp pilus tip-associated adhesin PilY1
MDAKLHIRFSIILIALACLLALAPVNSWGSSAGTFEGYVVQEADDAEEYGGWVDTSINDLELGMNKKCGIRFQNVTIPPGSSITKAYIQFSVDDARWAYTDLTFWGENNANPAAFVGAATNSNISSRSLTTAKVDWINVPQWGISGESGYQQQTPDLSSIVQEIVDQGGWASGNSIVFIVDGNGERVARAFKYANTYGETSMPLLHVEYATNAIDVPVSAYDDDAEERSDGTIYLNSPDLDILNGSDRGMGLRFQNVQVPQGVQITRAYIEFVAHNEGAATLSDAASMVINGQATDDAMAFSSTVNDISSRPVTNQNVTWDPVPAWDLDQTYQTPDISAVVQEIVGRAGWMSDNSMAFIFTHGTGWRVAYSYDTGAATNKQAVLHIEYADDNKPYITTDNASNSFGSSVYTGTSPPSDTLTITNTGSGSLDYTLAKNENWLTLSSTGGSLIPTGSDTVTLTYNTAGLAAGTYTDTVTITGTGAPNSPVEITINVTVLEAAVTYSCGHVPVYTENLISPAILILLDLSGSMDRKVVVAPGIIDPKTPDLSSIVQEIVNRANWVSGNAMAFIIEGTGRRTAISRDQDSALAPILTVTYNNGVSDQTSEIRVAEGNDDAEEPIGGTTVNLGSGDLEMVKDLGGPDQIIGIRFQNITIPNGATIKSAVITFIPDEKDGGGTDLTIWGEDIDNAPAFANLDNNISSRTKTTEWVAWNNIEEWDNETREPKIDIAKSTINELIQDRSISWGFGSWAADRQPYDSVPDYTIIHEGCKPNNDTHIQAIQNAVSALDANSYTPFEPSIIAARKYFASEKPEDEDLATPGDYYVDAECQPKFLINITDGIGNRSSTTAGVNTATAALADDEVTPIAVGFDLPIDQAEQIYEMAKVANEKGNVSQTDDIWAMHDEISGVGQPFFANSKTELIAALNNIKESIKGAIFHGSAPAPTTSVDLGDTVIVAKFDASRWLGDVDAITKDTNGLWTKKLWNANKEMPAVRNIWTIHPTDASEKNVVAYTESTLATDQFSCFDSKPIGDIINSTPVVVGKPPFWYSFEGYRDWAYGIKRDTMVYIGANDGSLHAIRIVDGVEQWAFIPKSMHDKLNQAQLDPLFDRCAPQYCHQYYVDGSPVVGDVFADFGGTSREWRSILVVGEREGGETYFALDITSGRNFDDSTAPTEFLWEFKDTELGQTWSDPSINRVEIKGKSPAVEAEWGVFFGSGYAPNATDQANKEAYLYGVLAGDATPMWKDIYGNYTDKMRIGGKAWLLKVKNYPLADSSKHFDIGETVKCTDEGCTAKVVSVKWTSADTAEITVADLTGGWDSDEKIIGLTDSMHQADLSASPQVTDGTLKNNSLSSPLVVDLEGYKDHIADRIYAGDLYGNMYRFDNIGRDEIPVVSTLFTYNNSSANVNPIRAKAEFAYADKYYDPDNIWVYFGSGIYETQTDKSNTDQQYFFGLKDSKTSQTATYDHTDSRLATLQAKFDVDNISGTDVTFRYIDGTNPYADPWKIQLYEGTFANGPASVGTERIITQPLVVGGVVFFTTFIPDENICAGSGETWVFAVDYKTGQAVNVPVFDINNDGKWDENDKVDLDGDGVKDVIPVGIKVGRGQGSHPVLHKDTLFITVTGDGNDGGGSGSDDENFFARKINLPERKVRLKSWMQN